MTILLQVQICQMVLWVDRVAIHRVETDREEILRVALNLGILNRQ